MPRPSSYSDEIAEVICDRLTTPESLRRICRSDGMPNVATVYRWLAAMPEFQERYTVARLMQADAMGDLIIEIADDTSRDFKMRLVGGVWRWTVDREHIERARLRCDTLRWLMARIASKKYGKRVAVKADGGVL